MSEQQTSKPLVQVWWCQGDDETCVSKPLPIAEAERLQHKLYALRDLKGDERIAYDADFEVR